MPFVSSFLWQWREPPAVLRTGHFSSMWNSWTAIDSQAVSLHQRKKGDWEFRGFLQAVFLLEAEHQRNPQEYIWRSLWERLFPKTDIFHFSVHRELYWISAGWEIHHETSAYILVSHKVESQGQQNVSGPTVPDGPSDAHKDSHFPSHLSWRKHRKGLH